MQRKMHWLFLYFALINFNNVYSSFSICSTTACPGLSNHGISCHKFENSIDCLMSISKNETQLGYVLPYQAIAATKFIPNLEIIGEVTKTENSARWAFEIVVVTNKDVYDFKKLKNFNYCNWGFSDAETPNFVVDGIERALYRLLQTQGCQTKTTFVERQLCELNEFFGASCRPGLWTNVPDKDNEMKSKYKKLCQLCPDEKCLKEYPAEICVKFNEAVLVVTHLEKVNYLHDLRYLCPNGTTTRKPCVWYQQPYPLIYTYRGLKDGITPKLKRLFSICLKHPKKCKGIFGNTSLQQYLRILHRNESQKIVPDLDPYYINLENKHLKWCTVSNIETTKCKLLRLFTSQPFDCIQMTSKSACVEAIDYYKADLVDITNIPIKDNLTPIAISITNDQIADSTLTSGNCVDKYYRNEMSQIERSNNSRNFERCPYGIKRLLCGESNCTYISEIIMRSDDPNRENAKILLLDIINNFKYDNATRPFDFFGKFEGVPHLLLQSNAQLEIVDVKNRWQYVGDSHETSSINWTFISRLALVIKLIVVIIVIVVKCRRKRRNMLNEEDQTIN